MLRKLGLVTTSTDT